MNREAIHKSSDRFHRENIPAVLLVGGLGTRLQSVLPSATPKPMAPVGGTPFLELLVLQLRSQGIRRVVMCTGHRAEQIEEQFGDGRKWEVSIEYSRELHPLGTAGALKLAEGLLEEASDFLVMNGDSFLAFDFSHLLSFHREHHAVASMAVREVADASRYGTVDVDAFHRVVAFCEKTNIATPGIVNGGVYLFNQAVWKYLPEGPASLERDVFPRLVEQGVYASEQDGIFIDIGTPADYSQAQTLFERLSRAAIEGQIAEK